MMHPMVDGDGQRTTERVRKSEFAEVGSSALLWSGGQGRDEFHRALKGDRAAKVFREMRENDPVVGALLFAIEMIMREATWRVDPAPELEEDPQGPEDAEFVWGCLQDMSRPWPHVVSSILSFLPFGWSYHETVMKFRRGPKADPPSLYEDGAVGWRKLGLRPQDSLVRWAYDPETGALVGMVQQVPTGVVTIPIEKSLLFRTTTERDLPEGRAILRNAYRPWHFKKRIEEVEGIGVERDLAGLPVALVPPEYLDDQADAREKNVAAAVRKIVRDIRRDEQEGVIFPREYDEAGNEMWELKLLSTGGRRQFDTDAIVARYDQRIAMTVLADFILLGHEKVGSFALGVSKVELFSTAVSAWFDEVESVFNRYAIPRLFAFNGWERPTPRLAHDEIKPVDLEALGSFVQRVAAAGAPLFPDDDLENELRARGGLPPRGEGEEV